MAIDRIDRIADGVSAIRIDWIDRIDRIADGVSAIRIDRIDRITDGVSAIWIDRIADGVSAIRIDAIADYRPTNLFFAYVATWADQP